MHAVAEAWDNWLKVLESHGFNPRAMLKPGASEEDIEYLRVKTGADVPEELAALYRISNGQHESWRSEIPGATDLFPCYRFLSIAEAVAHWQDWRDLADQEGEEGMAEFAEHVEVPEPDKVAQQYWTPGWLPFTVDAGGNALVSDTVPLASGTVGQIVVTGSDEDYRRIFAPSLVAYIEALVAYPLEISEDEEGRTWDALGLR